MSPQLANRAGTARFAVVGASTETGSRLRDALAASGVPGERVNLYGLTRGEAVISEYAGEARLIQDPDLREISAHDVIYLCEPGELARDVAAAAPQESRVIDLAGCLDEQFKPRLVHMAINPEAARDHRGFFSVPHPLALLLVEPLHELETRIGIEEVIAVVLRPAADFGQEGLDELREQTVRLLSFAEVPVKTLGGQLAFNILDSRTPPDDVPRLEYRVRGEVERLLGWNAHRLSLRVITAPVFYGHCLQLRFRTRDETSLDRVREALGTSRFFDPPVDDRPATPLEIATESKTILSPPSPDGLGGYWLWVVSGETATRGAEQAVQLARVLGDL